MKVLFNISMKVLNYTFIMYFPSPILTFEYLVPLGSFYSMSSWTLLCM